MHNDCKDSGEMKIGQLMMNIGRLHSTLADRFMEGTALFRGQAFLLMMLSHHDGMTHSELAEKLEISPAAVTKVIKRLEERRYLQRRSDPTDERVSRVFLEEEGWALTQQIKNNFWQIDKALIRNLSAEEQEILTRLLKRVYTNLLEETAEPAKPGVLDDDPQGGKL